MKFATVWCKIALMDWNNLQFFLAVARNGTIRSAAESLKVNHSTVSRRINAYEEQVGMRLFNRANSGYTLMPAGVDMLVSIERIESEVLMLDRKVQGKNLQLSGELRVTMPEPFAIHLMAPVLAEFCQIYPEIELDLAISNRNLRSEERRVGKECRL